MALNVTLTTPNAEQITVTRPEDTITVTASLGREFTLRSPVLPQAPFDMALFLYGQSLAKGWSPLVTTENPAKLVMFNGGEE